jgi:hypothetical protein
MPFFTGQVYVPLNDRLTNARKDVMNSTTPCASRHVFYRQGTPIKDIRDAFAELVGRLGSWPSDLPGPLHASKQL